MANDTTLAELRVRALDYADMTNSSFPVTARVTDYVNTALAELHDTLVNTYDDYYLKTTSFSIVSGTETYPLPSDFYKLRKMWYLASSRRWPIERFHLDEVGGYKTGPIQSGSAELWYVPQVEKLVNDTDVVDFSLPIGWEDFVCLHAAVRLLLREESFEPAGALANERERILARIIAMAEPRDTGDPPQIGDYYGRHRNPYNLLQIDERYYRYKLMGDKIRIIEIEYLGI